LFSLFVLLVLNRLPKHAELYLQGIPVGYVEVSRCADSWQFGSFQPLREFSRFAPLFGEWSLLIHADENEMQLSRAASDELRKLEFAIDALHAELLVPETGQRLHVDQLNIDGDLIECKVIDRHHA